MYGKTQKLTTLIKPDKTQYSMLRSRTRVTLGCLLASEEKGLKKTFYHLLLKPCQAHPQSTTTAMSILHVQILHFGYWQCFFQCEPTSKLL